MFITQNFFVRKVKTIKTSLWTKKAFLLNKENRLGLQKCFEKWLNDIFRSQRTFDIWEVIHNEARERDKKKVWENKLCSMEGLETLLLIYYINLENYSISFSKFTDLIRLMMSLCFFLMMQNNKLISNSWLFQIDNELKFAISKVDWLTYF